MGLKHWIQKWVFGAKERVVLKMLKCIRSGEQLRLNDEADSSESLATRDYSASGFSSKVGEVDAKVDTSNIEEAESSLRESGFLNYEEARALLGRLEYQKGNIEAALHVFDGIDIVAVTSKIRVSLSKRYELNQFHSQSDAGPPLMSMHAISLLLEALFLKSKSLQGLGRYEESAKSCKLILDTIEPALPEGLPEYILANCKLQEIVNKAVELLPELWGLAGDIQQAILSYRRALISQWNLDTATTARIEKDFAVFLLYSGIEPSSPTLRSHTEGSFMPRNNIEEATLLLLVLLRKFNQRKIPWDPTILDHLSFALSISGGLRELAHQVEELPPGIIGRSEWYSTLALSYHGESEDRVALNLLHNMINNRENPDCTQELVLAAKICAVKETDVREGITYARKAVSELQCTQMLSAGNCILGRLLSTQSRKVTSDSEKALNQTEALEALGAAEKLMKERDPEIIFHVSLENAEMRKLEIALCYAKQVLRLEAGSSIKSYVLLARILSAQKRFVDAETVINAALDETGRWDQGELLLTKAKLQIAQGCLKNAVETYVNLLAILQVQSKSSVASKNLLKGRREQNRLLEVEAWNDLANVYINLSQWHDAEVCILKSKAVSPYSASSWHSTGVLYEAKGSLREALTAFKAALDVEPTHVPSLISTASVLRKLGSESVSTVRTFLTEALRVNRMNHVAWYNLGLLYQAYSNALASDAVECFEAAALLEETAPVEPFR